MCECVCVCVCVWYTCVHLPRSPRLRLLFQNSLKYSEECLSFLGLQQPFEIQRILSYMQYHTPSIQYNLDIKDTLGPNLVDVIQ